MGEHWLIPSFNFMLRVDGAFDIPLKSVQPFSRDNEYEPIQEGGMNDYVYLEGFDQNLLPQESVL